MNIKLPDHRSDTTARPASKTSLLPIAGNDRERPARNAEKPAAVAPKTNWAWTVSCEHFDWMDWHTVSTYAQGK
ncbi:hypothetical protein PanNE5_13760 [Pandoraea sp. NE5]|uniref:hypothetical protein n=1 Tax=Pandoraea sp. NE5 TaxID=2904129 RepID=UPI0021C390A6|nr:hypothetical protein [Pandoraea sp. NE5]BDD91936.1 hypothetical protein PanNE5_13760 [Pandoraea sp. NE5]